MIKVYQIEKKNEKGEWIPYQDRVFVASKQAFTSKETAETIVNTICELSKQDNSQFRLKEKQVSTIKFDEI